MANKITNQYAPKPKLGGGKASKLKGKRSKAVKASRGQG